MTVSSLSKTEHIKVKTLFVKDKVDNRDITIKDCPTEVIWADILTKPKQGKSFREMRAVLMNFPVDYIGKLDTRSQQCGVTKSAGVASKTTGLKLQTAPVNQEQLRCSSNRLTQECVGQVSWDSKLKRTSSGTLCHTIHSIDRGEAHLVIEDSWLLNSQGSDGKRELNMSSLVAFNLGIQRYNFSTAANSVFSITIVL